MSNYLADMENMKINVNWGTIYVGWEGPGKSDRLLNFEDIFNYASNKLTVNNTEEESFMTELLSLYGDTKANDTELIRKYLHQLMILSQVDKALEEKKWVVVLLSKLLKTLNPSEEIKTLTELTSFWAMFDYPEYSPHIVQGRKNSIKPKEYYTQEFSKKMVSEHEKWMTWEISNFSSKH